MSATPPQAEAPAPPPGSIRCARCGAEVPADADWCLSCGLAARTRIAPTPRWRIPVFVAAVLCALALAALAVAFVALQGVDGELRTLEDALRDRRQLTELREAGISACPRCGTLHDTDANFCPACGTSLHGKIPAPPLGEPQVLPQPTEGQ